MKQIVYEVMKNRYVGHLALHLLQCETEKNLEYCQHLQGLDLNTQSSVKHLAALF